MDKIIRFMLAGVGLIATNTLTVTAQGAPCPTQKASKQLAYRNAENQNIGVAPSGFVDLAENAPIIHGIDISKWQDKVDFGRAYECGARFAYIRLSTGSNEDSELAYRDFWGNARSYDLLVGGYHSLEISDAKGDYRRLPADQQNLLKEKNDAAAVQQAMLFIDRLREVLSYDEVSPEQSDHSLGPPYLPIALEVMARPQLKYSRESQEAVGAVYRAAVCAWIGKIRDDAELSKQPIVLFTTAHIYRDYGLAQAPCGLDDLPVWVSQHNRDGGLPQSSLAPETMAATMQLCKLDSTNATGAGRCILHQYSPFGGFVAFQRNAQVNLDRFYGDDQHLRQMLQHLPNRQ